MIMRLGFFIRLCKETRVNTFGAYTAQHQRTEIISHLTLHCFPDKSISGFVVSVFSFFHITFNDNICEFSFLDHWLSITQRISINFIFQEIYLPPNCSQTGYFQQRRNYGVEYARNSILQLEVSSFDFIRNCECIKQILDQLLAQSLTVYLLNI